jgi:predicted molibdopterin-dependent oxidoreductase YjgC
MVFEGQEITFRHGDSIAAALLAAGAKTFRETPTDGSPRLAYCMMGLCFECLVEVDGRQNQQACLIPARSGMVVHRQLGARSMPRVPQ